MGQPRPDSAARRRARLLDAFLLILLVVFGAFDAVGVLTVPGYRPPWLGYAFLLTALALNRLGRYTVAAAVTLTMFPVVILTLVSTSNDGHRLGVLAYLVLGVALASILSGVAGTVAFAAVSLATVAVASLLAPGAPLREAALPFSLVLMAAALAVVSIVHRDRLERDRQAELRQSEERLRLALEAARVATWEWDVASGKTRWSEGAEHILAVPREGVPASVEAYLALVPEEDRQALEATLRAALDEGGDRFTLRHRLRGPSGAACWIEAHGRVDRDASGAAVGTRGALLDVTERQRAEGEKEELIRELEAKNAELERFTYTVSHDLKSPLVTIRGFVDAVEKDLAAGRTDRLGADVARMRVASDRMQRLLHELLQLSRIGRVANPFERVGFAAIVQEAASLVQARLDAQGARLEVAPDLPEVYGDRLRLVEVVQNLLDNAAKFSGGAAPGRIRVGSRRAGERAELYVQDDGIGIEPRFHEKVFGLFDKLDPRTEGNGVGLAVVRRIVEVHGGRVWIESQGRGQGTTVRFTLPLPPDA